MMATTFRKKLFLFIFCLASITQGMYSTYFVSILTTIERIYQVQSKTAGAILSATEIGQIFGSLLISYYGGRGNKPRWISVCMTLSGLAALISISPHFLLATNSDAVHDPQTTMTSFDSGNESNTLITTSPNQSSDRSTQLAPQLKNITATRFKLDLPSYDHFCHAGNYTETQAFSTNNNSIFGESFNPLATENAHGQQIPVSIIIALFFICLLAIGFGSTAITTLGIPYMDDIISKEESPFYLGLSIGLKIFGPALGFLLGSVCIRLDSNAIFSSQFLGDKSNMEDSYGRGIGAWWLGLIIIGLPELILAIPMYCLSRMITNNDSEKDDYEDITYQAAEDHDIGGSHDFPAHILRMNGGDLDVTSSKTCFSSEVDTSSSREVLQACQSSPGQYNRYNNYNRNIAFEQPIFSNDSLIANKNKMNFTNNHDTDTQAQIEQPQLVDTTICLVVNHFGGLESTSFANNNGERAIESCQHSPSRLPPPSSSRSSIVSTINSYPLKENRQMQQQDKLAITNLSSSLSRLIQNRLLVLRMLSAVLHILPIAGFYTFLPKYLIEQFRITSSSASAISGLAGILFVGFGAFTGGTIIRVFNVNSRLMTKWIATSALLYTIGMIILMNLSCAHNQTIHYNSVEFVSTDCSSSCKCSTAVYNPICANGTTYISPCLAGCQGYTIAEDRIIFDGCGCSALHGTDLKTLNESGYDHPHINSNVATQGPCLIDCNNLIWYVVLFSIFTLIHASCEVGSMMFNLRCVKSDDRTLALGLITFTSSLFGTIPCSIIYGSIVDYTCVHRDLVNLPSGIKPGTQFSQESTRGACRAYENDSFRYYLHGITAFVMFLAFIVDCIISRRASEVDFYDGKDDSKADIRMGLKKSTETI